jgi:hypothetical protein
MEPRERWPEKFGNHCSKMLENFSIITWSELRIRRKALPFPHNVLTVLQTSVHSFTRENFFFLKCHFHTCGSKESILNINIGAQEGKWNNLKFCTLYYYLILFITVTWCVFLASHTFCMPFSHIMFQSRWRWWSCGMLHHIVWWVLTNVSEELTASVITLMV